MDTMIYIMATVAFLGIIAVAFYLRRKSQPGKKDAPCENSVAKKHGMVSVPFKDNKPPNDIYPLW